MPVSNDTAPRAPSDRPSRGIVHDRRTHSSRCDVETSAASASSPAIKDADGARFSTAHGVRTSDAAAESRSLGELLQRAREARGLSIDDLARAWLRLYKTKFPGVPASTEAARVATLTETLVALERGTVSRVEESVFVPEILEALGVDSQESDRILCAGGIVPPDLAALIFANTPQLDAVRALLNGTLGPADVFIEEGAG